MKPGLFFTVMVLVVIILATSFGLSIMPTAPIRVLPESVAAGALWVCPTRSMGFDEISHVLQMFRNQINIGFFFALMLLFASAGWWLYQALLKDAFDPAKFKNVWYFAKLLFFSVIIGMILLHTPNHWRSVKLRGVNGDFVLCESNNPDARPVRSEAVIPGR